MLLCLSVCLFVYLFICLFVCLFVFVFVCVCVCVCVSICLPSQSVLFVCLFISLFVCVVGLFVCGSLNESRSTESRNNELRARPAIDSVPCWYHTTVIMIVIAIITIITISYRHKNDNMQFSPLLHQTTAAATTPPTRTIT